MQNSTTIALSRMVAQQRAIDVTANNIANADLGLSCHPHAVQRLAVA
jgi:flagellar basal body rod protein FlgC